MPDPIDEFDALAAEVRSAPFWGDVLSAVAIALLVVCCGARALHVPPGALPLLEEFAVLNALASCLLV